MSTIFTKIIDREISAQFVYEDEVCVVIMDKFPAVAGQTLVIPKIEVDYIFDLPENIYIHLFKIAKKIAHASDIAFHAKRTCVVVEGFEVPHVHVKLYPMTEVDTNLGKVFSHPAEKSDEELVVDAEKIRGNLKS